MWVEALDINMETVLVNTDHAIYAFYRPLIREKGKIDKAEALSLVVPDTANPKFPFVFTMLGPRSKETWDKLKEQV